MTSLHWGSLEITRTWSIIVCVNGEYFIYYFCENGFHDRLWHPSCVYFSAQRQYTAVQKNAYTSEITFFALVPWCKRWRFKFLSHNALNTWVHSFDYYKPPSYPLPLFLNPCIKHFGGIWWIFSCIFSLQIWENVSVNNLSQF